MATRPRRAAKPISRERSRERTNMNAFLSTELHRLHGSGLDDGQRSNLPTGRFVLRQFRLVVHECQEGASSGLISSPDTATLPCTATCAVQKAGCSPAFLSLRETGGRGCDDFRATDHQAGQTEE